MEAERLHFVQVAHVAIGHHADTAEAPVNIRLHFPKISPDSRRLVHVLKDEDARLRDFQNVLPEIMPGDRPAGRLLGHKMRRHRIAHHHAEIGKKAPDVRRHKALIARPRMELLHGIGHGRRAQLAQSFKVVFGNGHKITGFCAFTIWS